jgi:ubiquinone/menaquinone biosynthesis C-methylase UbiE
MVAKPSTKYNPLGLLVHFRFWVAKLIYNLGFALLVRDESWQEELFASLAPRAGDRILDFGPGSSSSAISLALRYPEATFVIVDSNSKAAERVRLRAVRKQLRNITVIHASLPGKLPLNAGSFDAIICMLALHDIPPDEKLGIIKEMTRVLRHGGTLRAVDFDKPENPGERRVLEFARRISGTAAVAPHFNGSWVDVLAKGGLAGAIRQSSHSIGIGRISIVKARKR